MSQNRAQVDAGANYVRAQGPGEMVMEQSQVATDATAGNSTLTAASMMRGILDRSGPGAGYTDTTDTGDAVLAAMPFLAIGDSFEFTVRNTVAFALTLAAGAGFALSGANTAIAASSVRRYMVQCLANKPTAVYAGNTTNASATVTGFTAAQLANLCPGMGVAGAGIPASTTILALNPSLGTITLSAAATATGNVVALTFTPSFTIKGLWSASL